MKSSSPRRQIFSPKALVPEHALQDSGYHGSQDIDSMDVDYVEDALESQQSDLGHIDIHTSISIPAGTSPVQNAALDSSDKTPQSTKEGQVTRVVPDSNEEDVAQLRSREDADEHLHKRDGNVLSSPSHHQTLGSGSLSHRKPSASPRNGTDESETRGSDDQLEDAHSPSEGSSPIRPVVRKSSLNFASLPAREPLTAGKSIGARVSRTSHLDHIRTSYYSRPTGGKSLGNYAKHDESDDEDPDDSEAHELNSASEQASQNTENLAMAHNKTYTQRLQDQINMLGKSQPNGSRPSKSIPNLTTVQPSAITTTAAEIMQAVQPVQEAQEPKSPHSQKRESLHAPGAFPEDDDDDWIDPPSTAPPAVEMASPRPTLAKSHSADVMEGIHSKETVSGFDFARSEGQQDAGPTVPERPATVHGHGKSASVSITSKLDPTKNQEGLDRKSVV